MPIHNYIICYEMESHLKFKKLDKKVVLNRSRPKLSTLLRIFFPVVFIPLSVSCESSKGARPSNYYLSSLNALPTDPHSLQNSSDDLLSLIIPEDDINLK